ncbi:MAG: hypothetical protein IMF09_12825 [Proteobacteria bacterium]|nr:hypothetical protein [Pseudomonadota bacterium]
MLSLVPIDIVTIDDLKNQWVKQLDNIGDDSDLTTYLASQYMHLIDWHVKLCDDDSCKDVYIYKAEDGRLRAIAEILDSSRSKDPSVKLLDIHIEPDLNSQFPDQLDFKFMMDLAEVFGAVLALASRMAFDNGTNKLKIYGRTEQMQSLFGALVSQADEFDFNMYLQGKWLIMETGEGK